MKRVTLSFDDGPDPRTTPEVLDILAAQGVKSAFFAICSKLDEQGKRIATRAVGEGHWYGSHSHLHKTPMGWMEDFEDAIPEIDLGFEALGPLAGPERMYRPFGAGGVLDTRLLNPVGVRHLVDSGYQCVLWDFTPREWRNADEWVGMCLAFCEGRPWTCLALRDSEPSIPRHLHALIDNLRTEGYEIVQEIPAHCVPIRDGAIVADLSAYTATAPRPPLPSTHRNTPGR